ncbi:protein kinase domain-containing protein [Microbacterium rhizomatis]|nr:hypothetical protein [Microbacterium rhizomatis]
MGIADSIPNAANSLEGVELPGGWTIHRKRDIDPDATGGNFGICYFASRPDGTQGFVKVLNIARAFIGGNFVDNMRALTNAFAAERDLCLMCGERRLSRVVVAIDHGEIFIDGFGVLGSVSYIVFELATHDVRKALSMSTDIDDVVRLEYAHSMALGLRQLHSIHVAHQDVKPSNFLVFPNDSGGRSVGKLADLGQAHRSGHPSPLDSAIMPGDPAYAPPEQLYRFAHPDERTRREAADLYQLGSLISFTFTAWTMNALLAYELAPELHWARFGDSFDAAIPYLEDAFAGALEHIATRFPAALTGSLTPMVEYLCEPDPTKRGHPVTRRQAHGSPYALDRVVSALDLLARRRALGTSS